MALASCLNHAMTDPMVEALRRLIARTEGGRPAVAAAIHANEQTLYQIVAGIPLSSGKARGVGRDLRDRLTRAFPGWMDLSTHGSPVNTAETDPPPYGSRLEKNPVAHPVSQPAFDTPLSLDWGDVMNGLKLPTEFVLRIEDDAIGARYPNGTRIVFDRRLAPKVGKPILVEDHAGSRFVRLYGEVRGTHWRAMSTDPLYVTLDSQNDQLQILAVAAWIEA